MEIYELDGVRYVLTDTPQDFYDVVPNFRNTKKTLVGIMAKKEVTIEDFLVRHRRNEGNKNYIRDLNKSTLLHQYGGRCGFCGNKVKLHTVERAVKEPLVIDGRVKSLPSRATPDNIVASCKLCKRTKGRMDLEEYRDYLVRREYAFSTNKNLKLLKNYGMVETKTWDKKFYFEKFKENDKQKTNKRQKN